MHMFHVQSDPFRFISGAGMGISILCGIMMLSEIALVRLRGALGVCSTLAINVATLLSYRSEL